MIDSQAQKFVQAIIPQAIVNNASYTSQVIDTLGFNYASILFMLGATDIALTALKVQESDTSGGVYTDITGANFATAPATLPSATDDNKNFAVHINMQNRKRYLKVVATVGAGASGAFLAALAILSRAEIVPSDAASRGCSQDLTVVS